MELVGVLSAVAQLAQETIEAVEALRGPGNGAAKKKEVLDVIHALVAAILPGELEAIMRWADILINLIVSVLNITGKFKTTKKLAPAG
jgi:hypothetical protein